MPRVQFSLRTLLIAVTLLAMPLGWFGWQAKIVRDRAEVFDWLKREGAFVLVMEPDKYTLMKTSANWRIALEDYRLPWYRQLLGDHFAYRIIYLEASDDEVERVKTAFSEAAVWRAPGKDALSLLDDARAGLAPCAPSIQPANADDGGDHFRRAVRVRRLAG